MGETPGIALRTETGVSVGYWFLLSAVSLWLCLVFLPPYALQHRWWGAELPYLFFCWICHQLPERSFTWNGHLLAVCHRCLGLYVGFWLGLVLLPFWRSLNQLLTRTPRLLALFSLPMALDLLIDNTPGSRFVTGLLAAFPAAAFVRLAADELVGRTGPFCSGSSA